MKNRSIGFRLAAWYFLVFACGLGAFSVGAWFAMRASLPHAIDDELGDRVRGVATFMDRQISSLSIPEIRDEFREHSVLGPGGDLFRVCDEKGSGYTGRPPWRTATCPYNCRVLWARLVSGTSKSSGMCCVFFQTHRGEWQAVHGSGGGFDERRL
jgi:hypothetical protein